MEYTMKKILWVLGVINLVVMIVFGCGISTEQISETVKASMQNTFNSEDRFKEFRLSVTHVQVIKQDNKRYQGIATVIHDGTAHNVPVEIITDGSNVIWKTDPGAFMFILQKELKKILQ
jgi:uncharacterized secreted protein with C-terminal beta-propeller domain